MSLVPKISCMLTDGQWYSLQIKAFTLSELQATLRTRYYANFDNYNIIIKTLNDCPIYNQAELDNYFKYENKPETLKFKVMLEETKKPTHLRIDTVDNSASGGPKTERSTHTRINTETNKLTSSQILKRSTTSANFYLDKKFSELSKLIHDKFSSLEIMITNLTERIDSLESKIIDLPILSKPTFPKVTSEICEFSGFEITKEMIKSDKFSAIIELKNCSKKIFETGYVLTQKEKLDQDIISFQRMTLNQAVHPNTTHSYKIDFKLNKKLDQIQPHFIYKIFVLIKDQSQMNVGHEFPLQFYFDYDVVLQNANLNRVARPITMSSIKNEQNQQKSQPQAQQKPQQQAQQKSQQQTQKKPQQQAQQKSQQQAQQKSQQQAQQKSQQQPANKQEKISKKEMEEIYNNLGLDEYDKSINKEEIYKVIEECDGDQSTIITKLDDMVMGNKKHF